MNPRQKSYDSYDKTNKLLKLTNSYYHFRNLEIIKHRKPQYSNKPLYFHQNQKKKQENPFQTYYVKKQNQSMKNKLKQILLRPIKPNLNEKFLTKEIKLQKVKQIHKNLYEKKRDEDNVYFKERLLNQKAFINPKMMDKNYSIEHKKVLMKLSKIRENENIVLPAIKSTNENPSVLEYNKYYNTESALRSKDGDSYHNKMRSINGSELNNTYYKNNKDKDKDKEKDKDSSDNSINK